MVNTNDWRRRMLDPNLHMQRIGEIVHGQMTLSGKLGYHEVVTLNWQPTLPTRLTNITMLRGRKCILKSGLVGNTLFLTCEIPFVALKPVRLRQFSPTEIVYVGPDFAVPTCSPWEKIFVTLYNPTLKPITFKLRLDGFQVRS